MGDNKQDTRPPAPFFINTRTVVIHVVLPGRMNFLPVALCKTTAGGVVLRRLVLADKTFVGEEPDRTLLRTEARNRNPPHMGHPHSIAHPETNVDFLLASFVP